MLSHSRKAYSEATFTQTTEDFLRCLENAFAHFGGVPQTLVIDNLKAAVAHPDWFDPELTPKVQSFCQHYGTVILPTQALHAAAQGEGRGGRRSTCKNNALKGHTFASLEEQNRHLADWERTVADTRIHGTTKQQVGKVFAEVERAALLPLPRGAVRLLPRSATEGQPRRPRRSGQGVLLRAAGVPGPRGLGALGRRGWCGSSIAAWSRSRVHVRHEPGPLQHARPSTWRPRRSAAWNAAPSYLLGKVQR